MDTRLRTRLGLIAFVTLLAPAPAARADERLYQVDVQSNVMVSTRDKVVLATDIYLPARDGKPLAENGPRS